MRKIDLKRLLTICLACCSLMASTAGRADELTSAKRADIHKLFEHIGVARMVDQMSDLTVQSLRQSLRTCINCTPQTFDVIKQETHRLFKERMAQKDGMMDRMVDIYHKHFSQAEVQQLTAFYTTPLGKRVVAEMAPIAKEGLAAGLQWSQSLGPELQTRFKTELDKRALPMPTISSNEPSKQTN